MKLTCHSKESLLGTCVAPEQLDRVGVLLEDDLVRLISHSLHEVNATKGLRESDKRDVVLVHQAPKVASSQESSLVIPRHEEVG